jgi:apolipoprotein N-acyltransferase
MGPRILILAVVQGLVFAGVVLLARLPARRLSPAIGWLAFPALWTSAELGISFLPDGTFGSWAYSQVGQPALIQGAAVFGLWVISFLIAAVASGVAMTLQTRKKAPLLVAGGLFALNLILGLLRLATTFAGQHVQVAAAAIDADAYEHRSARTVIDQNLATVEAEAAQARALAAKGARYVVFPEKAALVKPEWRAALYAPLIKAADETGAVIVAGFDQDGPDRRNIAVVFTPHGAPYPYAKRHMVPGLEGMFIPGPGPGVFAPRQAVAICKDMDFQATLRSDAQAGIGVMLVPAWDFDADAWAHARMAILRGVEGGYAIVRSAKNGLVTVTDAEGRIVARQTSGKRAYAVATASVLPGPGTTNYLQIGDAFAWANLVLAALLLGLGFTRRRA